MQKSDFKDGAKRYAAIPKGVNGKDYPTHNVKMESDGGLNKVCKWAEHYKDADPMAANPHTKEQRPDRYSMGTKATILDYVGNTPLVRVDNLRREKLGAGSTVNLLAKCEFRESRALPAATDSAYFREL